MMKELETHANLQWWPIWAGRKLHVIDFQDLMGSRLVTI